MRLPEDLFRYWLANRRDFNGDRLYFSAFPNEVLRTDRKELLIHLNDFHLPSNTYFSKPADTNSK